MAGNTTHQVASTLLFTWIETYLCPNKMWIWTLFGPKLKITCKRKENCERITLEFIFFFFIRTWNSQLSKMVSKDMTHQGKQQQYKLILETILPYKIAKFFIMLTPLKKKQFQSLFFRLGINTCPQSLAKNKHRH